MRRAALQGGAASLAPRLHAQAQPLAPAAPQCSDAPTARLEWWCGGMHPLRHTAQGPAAAAGIVQVLE